MKKYLYSLLSCLIISVIFQECRNAKSEIAPYDLRCEYMTNPVGIEELEPRLSWKVLSGRQGQNQTAFQVRVSADSMSLKHGEDLLWDSGKRGNGQNLFIRYGGEPVSTGRRVYWQVRICDREGRLSAWSKMAYWEMGLLQKEDWRAQWTG